MPVLPALAVGSSLVSAAGSIAGGFSANSAAKQEANLQRDQANLALKNANDNAEVYAYNATDFVQRQKVSYLANGVTLEGSPTDVLQNTTTQSQKNVQAILDRGAAEYNLGMRSAAQTQAKGRAALIGGLIQGGTSLVSGGLEASKAGMFDGSAGWKVSTGSSQFKGFSGIKPYRAPRFR